MLAELLFGDFAETNEEAGACDGRTHLEDPETATGAVASLVSDSIITRRRAVVGLFVRVPRRRTCPRRPASRPGSPGDS